jgi:hypothetical protein
MEDKDYVDDSELYDIIIEHFRIVNDLLGKMTRKLKEHEDRIKALEIEPKNRIVDDEDE